MKILVFVKQVPDTDDVKLDPKTGNLKREGVQSMINPLDANAIEAAVQLKEKYGGTVAAICSRRLLLSAAMRHICCPTAHSAAQIPSLPLTPSQRLQRRSAITICCCSAATRSTATRPKPALQLLHTSTFLRSHSR